MKIARLISLMLVIVFAVTLFGACGKGDASNDASSGSAASITVAKDGESNFIIVKPSAYSKTEWDGALSIYKTYKEKVGAQLKNVMDDIQRSEDVPEIIVGFTNRPETATAKELLAVNSNMYAGDFIVCAVDGNIVIYGVSEEALKKAIDHFIANYIEASEIAGDLCDVQAETGSYGTLSIGGVTKLYDFNIVRSHYETSYLTQLELENLRKVIRTKTGYGVPIVEDAYVEASDHEIIIGGSNRANNMDEYDLGDYEIKVEGTKLYVLGGSDYAIAIGVKELTKAIENGTTEFSEGVFKSGDYNETVANYDGSEYRLAWSDEFDGPTIDESVWLVARGDYRSSVAPDGKPVYRSTDDTTFIHDGKLYMCAMKTDEAYYGGMVHTFNSLHYQYGYIEIKALVPDGDGFWAGFWLNGSDWAGGSTVPDRYLFAEFDIMESYGNATGFTPALHRWPTKKGQQSGLPEFAEHTTPTYRGEYADSAARKVMCPDNGLFSDAFHTFGCMWTEERITITVDGMPRNYLDTQIDPLDQEAFHGYEFIILSLATYFQSCPLTPNATEEEWENTNKFMIDYIRLFQNEDCDIRWF